ncbi:MAG: purine-nucleoside phosphorylase [Clostridia bacterium]|nr:purine-nucleoside phosphorylase [Clostridia bacterium]
MKNYPTPHINAKPEDFAKTVLMPGDPLRAKYIAENFLENARLVNNVRAINGYTGTYKGKEVSVMASGMGMPSIGIYSYELFNFFDVENIIRVGSAGALDKNINVHDIVLGMGASTNSDYQRQFNLPGTFSATASYKLLKTAAEECEKRASHFHVGNIISSDTFYDADETVNARWAEMGILAVEMEAAALYMNAAKAKKNALAICTISDNIVTGEALDAENRQNSFTEMMEIALETAIKI